MSEALKLIEDLRIEIKRLQQFELCVGELKAQTKAIEDRIASFDSREQGLVHRENACNEMRERLAQERLEKKQALEAEKRAREARDQAEKKLKAAKAEIAKLNETIKELSADAPPARA